MTSLARLTPLQRARCLALDEICREVQRHLSIGMTKGRAIREAAKAHRGRLLCDDQSGETAPLKLSAGNLRRRYAEWIKHPYPEVFVPAYRNGRERIPPELVAEFQRRATLPGMEELSVVIRSLKRDWADGKDVPGLGAWPQWWVRQFGGHHALPPRAPEFPFSDRVFYNKAPAKAERALGVRGKAEARKFLPHQVRDTSTLEPGRIYVSDDVRLDFLCVDDLTGKVTECKAYILMEWGTRYIPAFVLRPANAILAQDVDAMVARGLQALGIGRDYTTFLYFERGTVACSPVAQQLYERASNGRIKIIRAGLNGGSRWPGAAKDRSSGHWMGKGVIESFMRRLHLLLREAPGQRGSSYEKQPANLGWTGMDSTPVNGSLAAQAQKLADIQLHFKQRVRLDLPLLTFTQVNTLLSETIKHHNTSRDHGFQGFGRVTQRETAPGIWEKVA